MRDRTISTTLRRYYYRYAKRVLPRRALIVMRQIAASVRRSRLRQVWPISRSSARTPDGFKGWPDGKKFALVLRHDVESAAGLRGVAELLALDRSYGFRSAFYFVPEKYTLSEKQRQEIIRENCEVGIHGLRHDGSLYESKNEFQRQAERINHYLRAWDVRGFASPSSHHRLDWLHKLDIDYDSSTFDTDPFEPQPDNLDTIFPVEISNPKSKGFYIELPYTLPQDFTLFVLLREKTSKIWRKKVDWIAENGGMVLVNAHPDYMNFPGKRARSFSYPSSLYEDLLRYVSGAHTGQYWQALPREVAAFWRFRSRTPSTGGKSVPHSVAGGA